MAAAVRFVDKGPMDTTQWRIVSLTGDSSYPTGGYLFDNSVLDTKRIVSVEPIVQVGHIVEWNRTTGKLLFYRNQATANSNPLTEVTNGTSMTGVTVEMLVIGEFR